MESLFKGLLARHLLPFYLFCLFSPRLPVCYSHKLLFRELFSSSSLSLRKILIIFYKPCLNWKPFLPWVIRQIPWIFLFRHSVGSHSPHHTILTLILSIGLLHPWNLCSKTLMQSLFGLHSHGYLLWSFVETILQFRSSAMVSVTSVRSHRCSLELIEGPLIWTEREEQDYEIR